MKGIIVDYFEDKGFGFIKDEKEDKRFFHIKNIIDKNSFLSNITDYYFTDWVERKCFVINFIPSQNEKGLNALDITLTSQIFNDKAHQEFEAVVTDFEYNKETLTRTVSGINKGMSKPFGATAGGNGTYRIGYPEEFKEANIYFRRIDDIGWGLIEVRQLILDINDRTNITANLIQKIKLHLIGKKVKVISSNGNWNLKDNSILKI